MSGNSVRDMPFIFDAAGHAVGVVNLKGEEQSLAGAGDVLSINNLADIANAAAARTNIGAAAASDLVTANNAITAANTAIAAKLAAADLKTINNQSIVGPGNIVISGGSGGGISTVAFSVQVPLDQTGGSEMGAVQATSALDFTVASSPAPVVNGNANVTIYPGGGAVTFSGFVNPDNFAHSQTNVSHVSFIARPALGGGVGEKLVFGRTGAAYDGIKPTLLSATIAAANPSQVVLVFSESLAGTLATASAFAISGSTVSSRAAGTTADTVLVNLAAPVAPGATPTASYTKPGTNNLKDATGNEVDNFSGVTIANGAGALPTITAVVVSSAAPAVIEVTLSQPYTGTLPASSAFAVDAGHTISGISAGSSAAKINLTTSAFVSGETARTLSYTKPGTNPITSLSTGQQLASVSGVAITNNVTSSSGTLSRTITAPMAAENLTTAGYTDWLHRQAGSSINHRKAGANIISLPTFVNASYPGFGMGGYGAAGPLSWDAGDDAASGSAGDTSGGDFAGVGAVVNGTVAKVQHPFPATTSTHHAVIWVAPDNGLTMTVRATLSDGSATDLVDTIGPGAYGRIYKIRYAYQAAGTATLVISAESNPADNYYGLLGVAYENT